MQRRLTSLGFDVKASGKFDDATRAVIMRWQAARGYPKTGFLNTLEHKALVSEITSTQIASSDDSDDERIIPAMPAVAAAAITAAAVVAGPARCSAT